MSVIVISRGSYSRGQEVACKVAKILNHECISREVLLEASEVFNIPEMKLIRAIHDAPSILDRFTHGKERYVAYIRTALLRHVQKDKMVYHGFAGHFFLQDIPHVLKVRIIADLEDRIKEEMKREHVSADEARRIIQKDDDERRTWALSLYGIDTSNPSLYDMVFHLKTLTVDDVIEIVVNASRLPCFQTTPESQRLLDDRVLASQVEALLVHKFPRIKVRAERGEVFVQVSAGLSAMGSKSKETAIIRQIEEIAVTLGGAQKVNVTLDR